MLSLKGLQKFDMSINNCHTLKGDEMNKILKKKMLFDTMENKYFTI